MGNPVSESFLKSLLLGVIPIVLGTLIFGVILESYKSDLNFRGDIMKDYYFPLITKERQCSNLSITLADDFTQKIGLYNELTKRYNAGKDGSGPRLTEEYKSYLVDLLKKVSEYNSNSTKHSQELATCREELNQDYINIALVTGTIDEFHKYKKSLDDSLSALNVESQQKNDEIKKMLFGVNVDEIINEFFMAGDMTDERYSSSSKTDIAIKTVMPSLLKFFAFKAAIEYKANNSYLILSENYNSVLEKEISSRYKRNWLSRILN